MPRLGSAFDKSPTPLQQVSTVFKVLLSALQATSSLFKTTYRQCRHSELSNIALGYPKTCSRQWMTLSRVSASPPANCLESTSPKTAKCSSFPVCLAALILFLLVPILVRSQSESQNSGNVIRFVRNPDLAPDFKLADLDGKPVILSAAHGKVILLNFWATWCGPCRAEIPDLIELQTKYKDRLQIIGISVDEDGDADAVKKMVTETGINYPIAMASPEVRGAYGGIVALPTSFLVDTEGRVVQKHEGLHDPLLYEIEVRALLGMPIPARVETFEDTGEIFLKHADRALELPGVDLSRLTAEQKQVVLHRFNAESCTCGCNFTLAQCRIYDRGCAVSKGMTSKIVAEVALVAPRKAVPAKRATPSESAAPNQSPR
jgi:cytochrome c biogenesis protein CcmG, thiol:disulfide interchange protein DsbE